MYKLAIVSVIALVALQGILAKPRPRPAAATEKSQIDEFAANVRQIVRNASEGFDSSIDSQKISQTLTENTQALATKVKSVVDDLTLKAQEHKGDIENILNSIKQSLSETATKLQNAIGPEATQKAKELKKNLDEGLNKAISEAERLAKAAEPEATKVKTDLTNTAKNLLDQVVEVSRNLKQELDKNLKN